MEALYYHKIDKNKLVCELCPHHCKIGDSKFGICKVRQNKSGKLISNNYGKVSSLGFDPIEKKPLYHFYPGSEILSVGSIGCNLKCEFCQNWQISQTSVEDFRRGMQNMDPNEVVDLALSKSGNLGIAYTYNEPTVFYEFMLEIAKKAKENDLKNVVVTNGFINEKPLLELNKYVDAYSVDLKAFNNDFFVKYTSSKLEPVKESLKLIANAEKHLEVTNLLIPGLNDDIEEFRMMVQWISENLGRNTVLHLSRYYPSYKLKVESTSKEKMLVLYDIANKYLDYVFLGNVLLSEGNSTICPSCGEILINRTGYLVQKASVNNQGNCIQCNKHVFDHIK